jgi:uncharacterized protein
MPANLTPQYQRAELQFRRAQSTAERLAAVELMLQLIPKHKGSEKLQAELKTRLKMLRSELAAEKLAPKGAGKSYRITRQGAATLVVLGPPNVGKSRLLQVLTQATPEVADYPFTTREPSPGMCEHAGLSIQLIDTPPMAEAALEPALFNLIRASDGVILMGHGRSAQTPSELQRVIEQLHLRHTRLGQQTGFDPEHFGVVELRTLLLLTHAPVVDDVARWSAEQQRLRGCLEVLCVDLAQPATLGPLREALVRLADVIRVFTKPPGQPVDHQHPLTFPRGSSVAEVAEAIHHDLAARVKTARLWPAGVATPRTVGREHLVADGDIVELIV